MTNGSNSLHFYYDAQNRPAVVEYNWVPYAYVHNLQGDIIAIIDANGNKVVEYKYDAWGKPIAKTGSLANTLGTLNPFRYRGYVYDEETGLYYLRSRYYCHYRCRFENADTGLTQSFYFRDNLYNYTNNNPVNYTDKNGCGNNPFPWHSEIPFDYRKVYTNRYKNLYERWYNRYGWPVHERHWTDHDSPTEHSNPHDHHFSPSDPSTKPTNEDRIKINYPDNKAPDKWDGEDEWNEEKKKYEEENSQGGQPQESHIAEAVLGGAAIVGGGYLVYQGIKWLIAWGAAVPTGGSSLVLLAIP